MRILVTGARGQLGIAIIRELLENKQTFEFQVMLAVKNQYEWNTLYEYLDKRGILHSNTNIHMLDMTDENALRTTCFSFFPDVIINAGAYTLVEEAEEEANKKLAYSVNVEAVSSLAKISKEMDAKLVHISTDYVFDGEKKEPYLESDPAHPINEYGRTKLLGEEEVLKHTEKYFLIRTSWLYGEGKNFVKTMLELAEKREELRVVDNQFGTPTSAKELARLILYLLPTEKYGIYHGSAEGSTNWYEFALEIMRLAGKEVKVIPVSDEEYKTKAKRPRYSVLSNHKLNTETDYRMLGWKDALKEYFEDSFLGSKERKRKWSKENC